MLMLGGAALIVAGCLVLALLSAQTRLTVAPAGQYYYLDELSVQRNPIGSYTVRERWWVADDGSGRVVYSMRANSRRPQSFSARFGAGRFDSVAYPDRAHLIPSSGIPYMIGSLVPLGMSFDPERLPVDPVALGNALRADVAWAARRGPHGIFAEQGVPEAAKELLLIANALQDPMDPPALRSELFRTAGKLPGIAVQRGVSDPLGRSGEAITAPVGPAVEAEGGLNRSARQRFAIIFSPTTRQILAETQYPSDHPAQAKNWYTVFTGQVVVATDTTEPASAG